MIRDPWLRALVGVMCAIAGLYLLGMLWGLAQQFADILLLFMVAWLLAFVLEPLVSAMTRAGVPRLAAIAFTYATLLVLFSLSVVLLIPALSVQVVEIAGKLPGYAEQVAMWAGSFEATANSWLIEHRSPVLVDIGSAFEPQEMARRMETVGIPLLTNAVQVATGAATLLLGLVLALILSFYFMLDGARLADSIILALPLRARDDVRFLVAMIHRSFAGFLRGQVIQGLVEGVGTGFAMAVLGVDYALLSSVVAGAILLIPFLGPVVAIWLPVMVAIFTKPTAAIPLFIVLLLLQQIIFNVLSPRIMSRQVGLHPLLVFFAVLVGARVAGVWGALFGVPIAAVAVTMISFYRADNQERLARLQEHLPGQELVSVDPPAVETESASTEVPIPSRREAQRA
jgi:predicted PurR-regulated permease PerM